MAYRETVRLLACGLCQSAAVGLGSGCGAVCGSLLFWPCWPTGPEYRLDLASGRITERATLSFQSRLIGTVRI